MGRSLLHRGAAVHPGDPDREPPHHEGREALQHGRRVRPPLQVDGKSAAAQRDRVEDDQRRHHEGEPEKDELERGLPLLPVDEAWHQREEEEDHLRIAEVHHDAAQIEAQVRQRLGRRLVRGHRDDRAPPRAPSQPDEVERAAPGDRLEGERAALHHRGEAQGRERHVHAEARAESERDERARRGTLRERLREDEQDVRPRRDAEGHREEEERRVAMERSGHRDV